mgnify:CR=1 FL=1
MKKKLITVTAAALLAKVRIAAGSHIYSPGNQGSSQQCFGGQALVSHFGDIVHNGVRLQAHPVLGAHGRLAVCGRIDPGAIV